MVNEGSRMSRPVPGNLDDFDPIDLDRLVIDGEYRRAVMLRLRSEATARSEPSAEPEETIADNRDDD